MPHMNLTVGTEYELMTSGGSVQIVDNGDGNVDIVIHEPDGEITVDMTLQRNMITLDTELAVFQPVSDFQSIIRRDV